jgi:hypothetical protein
MADDSPNALNGHRLSRPLGGCSSGELVLASCNGSPGTDLLFRGDNPEAALSLDLRATITDAWRRHTLPGRYSLPAKPVEIRHGKVAFGQSKPRPALPGPKLFWLARLPPNRDYQIVGGGTQLMVSIRGIG